MTEIVAGEYKTNELSANAMGGTEQMAMRMVKYLPHDLLKEFQFIHGRVRELDPNLKRILVCHDLPSDPEYAKLVDKDYRAQFDKIVFVSNWQAQLFNLQLGIPYSEFIVIPNAIEPFEEPKKDYDGPIRLIYHTTPHRGLELLVPAFEELSKHENIELDVFSSFGVYGWAERDQPYQKLFDRLEALPNARYHGFADNQTVRDTLEQTHIFAYPSIWPETSCIAAIEAMSTGNLVVHPNFGALPETCGRMSMMYQFHENPQQHVQSFYVNLANAVNTIKLGGPSVAKSLWNLYHVTYRWDVVQPQWINLMKGILDDNQSKPNSSA